MDGTDAGDTTADAGLGAPDAGPLREVACQDESISGLMLFDTPSPAALTQEEVGDEGYVYHVDATGGGRTPAQSYVYARFTDQGLEKVDIDDEAAFTSTEWDIAFRRFLIRLNSGVSGPSAVLGGRTAPGTTFEGLDSVPADITLREEQYLTDTCEFVSDGSGIGSPATVLSSFWTYAGCLEMTGNVFVIQRADGRHVKLEVLAYYTPENQQSCDETSMISRPSGAGNVRLRWAFLD